jgi:hypothetical protein
MLNILTRLFAKSIVAIAKTYSAGSVAVPKLENLREIVEAEIKARDLPLHMWVERVGFLRNQSERVTSSSALDKL